MLRHLRSLLSVVARLCIGLACVGVAIYADMDEPETELTNTSDSMSDEGGDVAVRLDQCPSAVQATIRTRVGAGALNEIERSPAGRYEVDAADGQGRFEFAVAADGTYLGPDNDGQEDGPDPAGA